MKTLVTVLQAKVTKTMSWGQKGDTVMGDQQLPIRPEQRGQQWAELGADSGV